ncbi:EthD family reductase [Mucilaginibacter sp. ZT4R22]|uniref:EthD family reductase n=1 Tax=Mucilaginibacter pankratovii TaxID=2772110 RepID=A0ABR7WNK2_9SPHI|nr:EthD family reductase [Mucilaginibacter pankratovii]MBD1363901.1 EthD family reductase [Mucilaginibacter pankratovii]
MIKKIGLLLVVLAFVLVCQPGASYAQSVKKGMIKVTILYPAGEGKTFNMDYYKTKHIPLLVSLFAGAIKATVIEKGVGGRAPGDPAPYVAIGSLYFESVAAFQDGMKTYGKQIRDDIPNYSNITPVVQISEVVE